MVTDQIRFDDGAAYERYMGKWSRLAGEVFLDWLAPEPGLRWLDVGCSAGGMCHIYLQPGQPDSEQLLEQIRKDLAAWSDRNGRPILRMVTRAEAAEIEMDHPNSGDLILITEPGYVFRHESDPVTDKPLSPTDTYGMHGYLNDIPAVHASYLAIGAGIKKGNAGTFRNTEVAGRVAEWLGIEKPRERP